MDKLNYIDLFSGAGGLSEGFIKAGFNPIAHVEIDAHACKTLETRLVYHKLNAQDQLGIYYDYLLGKIGRADFIKEYGDEELSNSVLNIGIGEENNALIFDKVDALIGEKEVDLVVGGPPCQAYSLVGRSRDKNGMKDDPRNHLYKDYGKFLKRYQPKVFVFENVTGLLSANSGQYYKNMKAYFKRIGYHLDDKIHNSADFGVLQNRKRVILIGWRKDIKFSYPVFEKQERLWKITDLLKDLKRLKPGEQNNITKYRTKPSSYLEQFKLRNGVNFVTQHVTRPHNDRDLEIYKIAIKKWLQKGERLRYPDLPKRLKTHKNEKSFVDRFKVVDPNGYSHTMVAHISKDGHHYIYPDTKQVRSLSVREAARIQSFPDDYFFEGGRGAAFRQIGNAVPPLMAFEIAKQIKQIL